MRNNLKYQIAAIAALFVLIILIAPFLYILAFIILFASLYFIIMNHPKERRFLIRWFLIAFAARILFMLILQMSTLSHHEFPFFFLDDKSYHEHSANLALRWHQGERPFIWMDFEIGTLQTGYYRFIGAVYYLFGAHSAIPLALNSLLGAALALLLFQLALRLFDEDTAKKAVMLTAANPVFWYWSSFLIKDTMLSVFFILTLLLYLEFKRTGFILFFFALAISSYFLILIRIPSLMVIVFTAFVYEFLYNPKKKLIWLVVLSAAVLFCLSRFFLIFSELQDWMLFSFLNVLPDELATFSGTVKHLIKAVPRFFLSPYAWVVADYFTVYYFLYLGQWFMYLYLLPHILAGAYRLIAENNKHVVWLLVPIFLKGYIYLLAFGGSAPRHILELMPLFTLLAAYGLKKRLSQWFMYVYFGGLLFFMIAHFASIALK